MKLLFATGNENKYELMKRRLKEFSEIEVIMPKHINVKINVEEDGKTAEENAIKKANTYVFAVFGSLTWKRKMLVTNRIIYDRKKNVNILSNKCLLTLKLRITFS